MYSSLWNNWPLLTYPPDENEKWMTTAKKHSLQPSGRSKKQFGKGSVMRLGDNPMSRDVDVVSTGSIGLDVALGIGGVPKGRVVEIYGP